MDVKELLKNLFPIRQIGPNTYEIKTSMYVGSSMFLTFILEKVENGYRLSDNKQIAKILQYVFDFKAPDVQMCLKSVFQANGVNFSKGELFITLTNEASFQKRFMDFIICAGQLIRMDAFFDKPEHN